MAIGSVLQNDPEPSAPEPQSHGTAVVSEQRPQRLAPARAEMSGQPHEPALRESGLAGCIARPDAEMSMSRKSKEAATE